MTQVLMQFLDDFSAHIAAKSLGINYIYNSKGQRILAL